jgi:hypothetical protein
MSWGAPSDSGGGNLTYTWAFTAGANDSALTGGTSAAVGSKGAGSYSFHVEACNPGGCSGWTQSNTVTVSNPPPPPASIALVQGSKNTATNTAYFYHIVAQHFTPNEQFTVECYYGSTLQMSEKYAPNGTTRLQFDGSGNFSGDIGCYDGYHNSDHVIIDGVPSNSATW